MKIYTKTGDKGETSLLSGGRVSKSDQRINAYGSIDELNSFIGLLAAYTIQKNHKEFLLFIQNKLYNIGAQLAVRGKIKFKIPELKPSDVKKIETEIDFLNTQLPPLKVFIIPGGNKEVAQCHICRSVCRRAEREVVKLSINEEVDVIIINFINRLSDYFFVLARKLALESNIDEISSEL